MIDHWSFHRVVIGPHNGYIQSSYVMEPTTVHIGTFFTMSFYEGIFTIQLDQDIKGTPTQAWEWINCMHDIKVHLGRPFPLLTIVNCKIEFTSEARRIMRKVENEEHFVAHAVWANSLSMKAMVKFLMILVPRNLFDEDVFLQEENAIAWLREKIKHSSHPQISPQEPSEIRIEINSDPR